MDSRQDGNKTSTGVRGNRGQEEKLELAELCFWDVGPYVWSHKAGQNNEVSEISRSIGKNVQEFRLNTCNNKRTQQGDKKHD